MRNQPIGIRIVVYRTSKGQLICRTAGKRVWMPIAKGADRTRQYLPKRRRL